MDTWQETLPAVTGRIADIALSAADLGRNSDHGTKTIRFMAMHFPGPGKTAPRMPHPGEANDEPWSKHSQLCARWLPRVWVAYRLFARDLRPRVISYYYPIIPDEGNWHAVIEISLTADQNDIDHAKTRASVLTAINEGAVTPTFITPRPDPA